MPATALPPWCVFHIPHDSFYIPPAERSRILLTDEELNAELLRMTDFWTLSLYGNGLFYPDMVASPVSRLVVDVERFADDRMEAMALRGMGAVYEKTHDLKPLRLPVSTSHKKALLSRWYWPHHKALEAKVEEKLARYGKALILDVHSFSSRPLIYEEKNPNDPRPQICIGTDPFHTPSSLREAFQESFSNDFDVALNDPFAGTLVPAKHYLKDKRVQSLMIETRRDLYQDESTGRMRKEFSLLSQHLQGLISRALCVRQ